MQEERVLTQIRELLRQARDVLRKNPGTALEMLSQAILQAEGNYFAKERAESIRMQGLCYDQMGDQANALFHFNTALQQFLMNDNELGIAECRNNIGHTYILQHRYDEATEQLRDALATCMQLDKSDGVAYSYLQLSDIVHIKKDYQQELKLLFAGMPYANQSKEPDILSKYLLNIGTSYAAMGAYEQALVFLQQIHRDITNQDDPYTCVMALVQISSIYLSLGRFPKSISYAQKALASAEGMKDKRLQANCMDNLATAYQAVQNYEESLAYTEKVLPIYRELLDHENEVLSLTRKGILVNQLGDPIASLEILEQAYTLAREINHHDAQIKILHALAINLKAQFKFLESIKHLETAIDLVQGSSSSEILSDLYLLMSENYGQQRDFERSLLYHQKYHEQTKLPMKDRSEVLNREEESACVQAEPNLFRKNESSIADPHITALKSVAENFSNHQDSRLRTIIDALPDIAFVFDADGNYDDVMLSHAREDHEDIMSLKGKNIQEVCSKVETEKYMHMIHETIRTGEMQIIEYQFDPAIEGKWYEGRTALLKDNDSAKQKVLWVARDISKLKEVNHDLTRLNNELELRISERTRDLIRAQSELERELELRKRAAEMLQKSIAEQKALFSVIPAIVYYKDKDLNYISANQVFCDIFQIKADTVRGLTDYDLFPPEVAKEIQEEDRKVIAGFHPQGESVRHLPLRNGEMRWFSTSKTSYKNDRDEIVALVEVSYDITALKNQEIELIRLFTAIEQSAGTVCITDANGLIRYINPAFLSITGYARDEIIGKNPKFLQSGKHDKAFYTEMWKTVNSGQVWKGIFSNQRKDGVLFEEEATITPVKDDSGTIISFVKVSRDVTRENMLMLQLRQSQKMEAIGTLAGGIAHDFNNILGAIMGYSELIADDLPATSVAAQGMEQVMTAIERAKKLVNQILTFSKMTKTECESVKLQPIIKDTIKLLRDSIPKTIDIQWNVDEEAPSTFADPSQINQILLNLCNNATASMQEKGGVLSISLEQSKMSGQLSDREMPFGSYLKLIVSDTGVGIPKALLERIFDPFFTTKAPGSGSGLGLSVVHGIVSGYGGKIFVESTEGEGTTFTIFLKPDQELKVANPHQEISAPREKKHILVVDDESFITDIMNQNLTRLGYMVTSVNDSQTALGLIVAKSNEYDLLITDLTMPGVTGLELAVMVKKEQPNLPIILCSGLNELINSTQVHEIGICEILNKPIDRAKLAEVTKKILDEAKHDTLENSVS